MPWNEKQIRSEHKYATRLIDGTRQLSQKLIFRNSQSIICGGIYLLLLVDHRPGSLPTGCGYCRHRRELVDHCLAMVSDWRKSLSARPHLFAARQPIARRVSAWVCGWSMKARSARLRLFSQKVSKVGNVGTQTASSEGGMSFDGLLFNLSYGIDDQRKEDTAWSLLFR